MRYLLRRDQTGLQPWQLAGRRTGPQESQRDWRARRPPARTKDWPPVAARIFSVTSMLSSTSWISPAGNLTRLPKGPVRFTHQAIRHSRLSSLELFRAFENRKILCTFRPAEVAVDQQHAITLLGQCERIIGACEKLLPSSGTALGGSRNFLPAPDPGEKVQRANCGMLPPPDFQGFPPRRDSSNS